METTWTTIDGTEIEYKKLEDSHLLNIKRFIERRSEEGVMIGGGYDKDTFWGEELYGDEAKAHFDYEGICQEIKRRNLTTQ